MTIPPTAGCSQARLRCTTSKRSASADADAAFTLLREAAAGSRPFEVALLDFHMPGCRRRRARRRILADPRLTRTRLVLLTSSGQRGDAQRCAALGFAAYLLKPVTRYDLIDCLELVMSATGEAWHKRSQPIVTRHQVRASRGARRQADPGRGGQRGQPEGGPRVLEKLGYRVDVVENGREAVKAWESGRYDLILMIARCRNSTATRPRARFGAWRRQTPYPDRGAHCTRDEG